MRADGEECDSEARDHGGEGDRHQELDQRHARVAGTPITERLGGTSISREQYLERLADAIAQPTSFTGPL